MSVQAGEEYRFEQEVYFDGYLYGSTLGYSKGGQCLITRGNDGYYWDGIDFISPTWNSTVIDTSGLFHYYDWTVPAYAVNGDTFNFRIRITGDSDSESLGTMIVRPPTTGGGSGGGSRVFDAVDWATGFPSTYSPS